MGKRIAFGIVAVVLTCVLTLALVEIGLRVYSRVTPNADVEFFRYARMMKAAAPGSGVVFRHAPNRHERFYGVEVDTNSRGFRDRELPQEKPTGATWIALLGDSVTFGWGVPYGDRFSEILERAWSDDAGSVELVNTGHGNWNASQEYAALTELLAGEPLDGILQVWYINDAEPTPEHREAPWHSRFYLSIFLWSKTDLLQRRVGARQTYVEYYRGLYEEGAPGLAGFRTALRRTGEWARERNLPWVYVVLPEFHEFPGPFTDIYRKVAEEAAAAGAIVVDLTGAFAGEDAASMWVAHNDVHPNAKGHAAIARAILDRVDPSVFRHGA